MSALNQSDAPARQPITVPAEAIDQGAVVRPAKAVPVWVRLRFDDGRAERTEMGFAMAWTSSAVEVQVLWPGAYCKVAREFWFDPAWVRRRVIRPQWLGRDPM